MSHIHVLGMSSERKRGTRMSWTRNSYLPLNGRLVGRSLVQSRALFTMSMKGRYRLFCQLGRMVMRHDDAADKRNRVRHNGQSFLYYLGNEWILCCSFRIPFESFSFIKSLSPLTFTFYLQSHSISCNEKQGQIVKKRWNGSLRSGGGAAAPT